MRDAAVQPPLRIAFVGHVDHGKSTVVGRLLNDVGALPEGKVDGIADMCKRRGMPFEWAFVMDALKAERDQGITIDVAQITFRSAKRRYVILDAPGHREFVKNMVTGAAQADAAVLIVDAAEGVQEQTRRHAYLLHLLGISQVVVAVTKMDLVGFARDRFDAVVADCVRYLNEIGLDVTAAAAVPVSGRDGANIVTAGDALPWYDGPSLVAMLDALAPPEPEAALALRLPVQDVYKFDHRRIIAGRIESGRLAVGDRLLFSPSNKEARVATIERWPAADPATTAEVGQSIGITLDHQIFVERGETASHEADPPIITNAFTARVFWLGNSRLRRGLRYKLKLNAAEYLVEAERVLGTVDLETLARRDSSGIARYEVGEVRFRARGLMALDAAPRNLRTGRFVLVDGYRIVGGGLIAEDGLVDRRGAIGIKSENVARSEHIIAVEDRWHINGHKSGILWLTGLPAAGKTTLAFQLERLLFERGMQAYVLDGENIRHDLSADLGFSREDRAEHARRVGQTARIFARAGMIVIVSVLSPYRADRDAVRTAMPQEFHEIFLSAPIDVCEARDPKGQYARARRGEIADFTGVSAPYEPPVAPEMVIDTARLDTEESTAHLLDYVQRTFRLDPDGNGA